MKTLLLILSLLMYYISHSQTKLKVVPDTSGSHFFTSAIRFTETTTKEPVFEIQYIEGQKEGKFVFLEDTMSAVKYLYDLYTKQCYSTAEEGSKYYQLLKDYQFQLKRLTILHNQINENNKIQIRVLTEQNRLLTNQLKNINKIIK